MKIPINDRRVTINGAIATHTGTVSIIMGNPAPGKICFTVFGQYGDTEAYWCAVEFEDVTTEDISGSASVDMKTLFGLSRKEQSENMLVTHVFDLVLQDIFTGITFNLFPSGEKTCRLSLRGIKKDPVAVIEKIERLNGLFSWPR